MKLKSSKPTCNFNHAIPAIVCRLFQLKAVSQTICQSTKTHNTPTYYSNAYIRTGMYSNFFLGEVVLWYSIYVLLAEIRTTWVANTRLFTYALTAYTYYSNAYIRTGMYANFFLGEVVLWYSIYILLAQIRTTGVASTHLFTYNTHLKKIRNSAVSKFWWKSVELSKLKEFFIRLDIIQMISKSNKDIRTSILVLSCKQKAKQFEAHPIYKSLLGTKIFSNKTKINYV